MAEFDAMSRLSSTASSTGGANRGIAKAVQLAECAICFDALCTQVCSCLHTGVVDARGRSQRSCVHYFHLDCANKLINKVCPICRVEFTEVRAVPNPVSHPREWFETIDANGNGHLDFDEVLKGLETGLELDWSKIAAVVDRHWGTWDIDESGEISLEEFMHQSSGLVRYLVASYPPPERANPPDITDNQEAWFRFWDEDGSETLDRSEVVRALMKTFRIHHRSTDSISQVVAAVFPIFDHDGSGTISLEEFTAIDGLGDSITAQLDYPN